MAIFRELLLILIQFMLLHIKVAKINSFLVNDNSIYKKSFENLVGTSSSLASRGFGSQHQPSNNKTKKNKGHNDVKKKTTTTNSFQEAASKDPEETKRVLEIYGGDIQQGTIRRINEARVSLEQSNPLLGEAMKLKEETARWNSYVNRLGVLQRADLSPELFEVDRRRNRRLEQLAQEYGINDTMIHNAFQKATWDASADARALRGKASLSADMKARLNKALSFAVQPVMESIKKGNGQGRILDVGSGTGALIPEIVRLGIPAKCILGIDISPGMTRVASGAYPDVTFVTNDFLNFIPENGQLFDSILFCMAIHDLPDPLASINHALKLLRSGGGRIVISHPRGASHVVMQHRANPVMVPHLLPSQEELESLICSQSAEAVVNLLLPPNLPNDERDKTEGYLCVIEKI